MGRRIPLPVKIGAGAGAGFTTCCDLEDLNIVKMDKKRRINTSKRSC